MVCLSCDKKNYGAPSMHGPKCGCPECGVPDRDVAFYGNGFGLGITTDQSGQSWLGGKKVIGWQGDTPMTQDSHGNMFANILNMNTGTYMPGVQMPTTISARGGGAGPIATAPTGSGRVFWAPSDYTVPALSFVAGAVVGVVLWNLMKHE